MKKPVIIGLLTVYLLLSWQVGLIRLGHSFWHTGVRVLQQELSSHAPGPDHGHDHHHPAYVEWILAQDSDPLPSDPALPSEKKDIDKHQREKRQNFSGFAWLSEPLCRLTDETARPQVSLSPLTPPPRWV